jgi:hypothetical protein
VRSLRRDGPSALALCALLLSAVGAGCAGPTVTDGGYRAKTAGMCGDISSSLATAKLAVSLDLKGRMALALTDESVSQAESDASSSESSWESRQPPSDAMLALHDQISGPAQDAVSALQALRIAVRRGDFDAIRTALGGLDKPAAEIDRCSRVVSG